MNVRYDIRRKQYIVDRRRYDSFLDAKDHIDNGREPSALVNFAEAVLTLAVPILAIWAYYAVTGQLLDFGGK